MAYSGYLVAVGEVTPNTPIPLKYIKLDSYQVTWNSQEYTAYRDATGELHRNSLASRPPKVEFYTRNMLTNSGETSLTSLMNIFKNAIGTDDERKKQKRMRARIYIPEIDDYVTDDVYLADCTPSIYRVDGSTLYYNSFRIALIGYGTGDSYK